MHKIIDIFYFIFFLNACGGESNEMDNPIKNGSKSSSPLSPLEFNLFSSINKKISGKLKLKKNKTAKFKVFSSKDIPPYIKFNLKSNGEFTFETKLEYTEEIIIPIVYNDDDEEIKTDITFHTQIIKSNGDDPLFIHQWHLKNTGQNSLKDEVSISNKSTPGVDINLGLLHNQGVTGRNVNLAVVDDGLDINHEDLETNIIPGRSWDFVNNDSDPSYYGPGSAVHGTAVSGIASSTAFNNRGGRGVAPDASLQGLNYLKSQTISNWRESIGGKRTNDSLVINMSFGAWSHGLVPQDFTTLVNSIQEEHLKKVTTENNSGRGVFLAKAAGNNFNSAFFGMIKRPNYENQLTLINASLFPKNSSFYTTTVSGLSPTREKLNIGSTVGSAIFVSAPGFGSYEQAQTVTTDISGCNKGYSNNKTIGFDKGGIHNPRCDYTNTFSGTSSATPVVAGVAALLFGVNDRLSWRDVRHILASTATKVDPQSKSVTIQDSNGNKFIARLGWVRNKAGYSFHNWYGLGMVNATKAIQMATNNYTPLPPLQETPFISAGISKPISIPEGNTGIEKTISISDDYVIEGAQLKFSLKHSRKSDVMIELVSPSGTRSILLTPRSLVGNVYGGSETDFKHTVLLSNAFYGENSKGDWKVKVYDTNSGSFEYQRENKIIKIDNNKTSGELKDLSLRIYGHNGGF